VPSYTTNTSTTASVQVLWDQGHATHSKPMLANKTVDVHSTHDSTRRFRVGQRGRFVRTRSPDGSDPGRLCNLHVRQSPARIGTPRVPMARQFRTCEWSVACSIAIFVTSSHRVQLQGRNPGSAAPAGDGRIYIPAMCITPAPANRHTTFPTPSLLPPRSGHSQAGPPKLCHSLGGRRCVARAVGVYVSSSPLPPPALL
jgi:hypothetical protein